MENAFGLRFKNVEGMPAVNLIYEYSYKC